MKERGILLALGVLIVSCTDPAGSDWVSKGGIGAPCTKSWECASGYCIPEMTPDGTSTG